MTEYHFVSITKFVEFINNNINFENIIKSICYFEGDEMFKNKYEKQCVKPLFIELISKNGDIKYISHKEILNLFDGQLVISYNENQRRKIEPKKDHAIYKLTILFEKKQFNGNNYYNSNIIECNNVNNCEKIRKQVTQFVENDLPDDYFIDIA